MHRVTLKEHGLEYRFQGRKGDLTTANKGDA